MAAAVKDTGATLELDTRAQSFRRYDAFAIERILEKEYPDVAANLATEPVTP